MIVPSAEQIRQRLEKIQPVNEARKVRYDHGGGRMYREEGRSRSLILDVYEEGDREFYFNAADDVRTLLTLLETLSQELERLKKENQELLTRSGKPDADRDFSIHAATDGEG